MYIAGAPLIWCYLVTNPLELTQPLRVADDCFEQAMLMAIELSKSAATEPPGALQPCKHCGKTFPPDAVKRHQGSCVWEQQRTSTSAKSVLRATSKGGGPRAPSPPRWVPRPVEREQSADDDITLPCEFCDESFLDADLLRHQLRCEKNANRLDLPARRPLSSRPEPSEPTKARGGTDFLSDSRRRSTADLTSHKVTTSDLEDRLSRRWSMLDVGDHLPKDQEQPKPPHRKSKHKKRVNFLGQDEVIHPEPEYTPDVMEGEKKKKKHKKRSSKKHRAPEPPTDTPNTLFACDY